ncbi:hypothetical protein, conserved [Plasmodium gonderi]|uniref:PDZ domain-containing protein n=1 Tax=Plasmodium gonderi TaxID=77519 RepID=A0A1Y1JDY9_PLAGO|nr:hypothetical protein, conserved [Plasmodium gonderi]GAW80741.1 hypothetical protein, conserved [Plasmodium gonderi]
MNKFWNFICTFYIILHVCLAFKLQNYCKRGVFCRRKGYSDAVTKGFPLQYKKGKVTKSDGRNIASANHRPFLKNELKKNVKLFYKNKKERDILESGYLYPFDHLEKKKKKFPPDPYRSSDEDREEAEEKEESIIDLYDDKLNDNDFLSYDEDDDAKKNFGKTTFNMPTGVHDNEEEQEEKEEDESIEEGDYQTERDIAVPYEGEESHSEEKSTTSHDGTKEVTLETSTTGAQHESAQKDPYSNKKEKSTTIEYIAKGKSEREREIVKINLYSSEENKIKCEMMKDQLYYLFHASMDSAFIDFFEIQIETFIIPMEKNISVSHNFEKNSYKVLVTCVGDLIDFSHHLQKLLNEKIKAAYNDKENEEITYINKRFKKILEKSKKQRIITDVSKKNLQMSIESSLKLIEKCTQKLYTQNYEITLHDLKLAYNMLPCKYYGYFLSHICSSISMLCYYTNDIQGTFNFSLKSIKYEPKHAAAWKCLGDAYRSFRKFWQAKNFYDIAIYLGYKDDKGENFEEIKEELNKLTTSALKNVHLLKENMNSANNIIIKKNIGIVLNKNPDSIGGCYVSYIIEEGKASKKNFRHGDQIVALNNIVTYGKPIEFCLKAFQKNFGSYDIIFFKGNIIELYGLPAYKYLIEKNMFHTLFENEKITSFKRNETILFDLRGFGTFSEYGISKADI